MHLAQLKTEKPGDEEGQGDEADGHQGPFQHPMVPLVQPVFAKSDGFPKAHDGVGKPSGVAQEQVEEPADEEGYERFKSHGIVF